MYVSFGEHTHTHISVGYTSRYKLLGHRVGMFSTWDDNAKLVFKGVILTYTHLLLHMLLLSHFSRVQLCATP